MGGEVRTVLLSLTFKLPLSKALNLQQLQWRSSADPEWTDHKTLSLLELSSFTSSLFFTPFAHRFFHTTCALAHSQKFHTSAHRDVQTHTHTHLFDPPSPNLPFISVSSLWHPSLSSLSGLYLVLSDHHAILAGPVTLLSVQAAAEESERRGD